MPTRGTEATGVETRNRRLLFGLKENNADSIIDLTGGMSRFQTRFKNLHYYNLIRAKTLQQSYI